MCKFPLNHHPLYALRFSKRGYKKDGEITNLPLYLAGKTIDLLWNQELPDYCSFPLLFSALIRRIAATAKIGSPERIPFGAGPRSLTEPVFVWHTASGSVAAALNAPWKSAGTQILSLFWLTEEMIFPTFLVGIFIFRSWYDTCMFRKRITQRKTKADSYQLADRP